MLSLVNIARFCALNLRTLYTNHRTSREMLQSEKHSLNEFNNWRWHADMDNNNIYSLNNFDFLPARSFAQNAEGRPVDVER